MKFREIAESQNVLLNTVLSRYRYGLEQLRSQLNGKVESWKTQRISKD
jgi:DNA-directed RNA polymerase specialized sigma24 family protein